jgi:hypothetical protein
MVKKKKSLKKRAKKFYHKHPIAVKLAIGIVATVGLCVAGWWVGTSFDNPTMGVTALVSMGSFATGIARIRS